ALPVTRDRRRILALSPPRLGRGQYLVRADHPLRRRDRGEAALRAGTDAGGGDCPRGALLRERLRLAFWLVPTTRAHPIGGPADISAVDETAIGEHQKELARLEVEAARLSAERDRLHRQIDFGFETAATRERERQLSDERRQLHGRIDALKKQLRTQQIA